MKLSEEQYLAHYGILRKSGRYPWGSGATQDQRNRDFLAYVDNLRKEGLTEAEIVRGLGLNERGKPEISVQALRAAKTIAINQQRAAQIAEAEKLRAKGMSNVAIAKQMGLKGESNVRALLDSGAKERADVLQTTAKMLKDQVGPERYLDVSVGSERLMPISGLNETKLKAAVAVLEEQGYKVHRVKIDQLGTGKQTEMRVLTPPGTKWQDVMNNQTRIKVVGSAYTEDGGRSFMAIQPPLNVSSKRVAIKYKEDGGDKADGVIYVRPGIDDISLGASRYAQVRIAVDGTHFIKGMAVYKDDLPPGVDLLFNTNKSNTGNKLDALKPMKESDPNDPTYNPFGSFVRQLPKLDERGNPIHGTVRSAMNIVNEEGDWQRWSSILPSQMLSKQNLSLAKSQLELTQRGAKADLDEILSLTNPAVRKRLLIDYADNADSAAIHLKALGLGGQGTHVILPMASMKETEVYAPNYKDGERVVLIRFPHGGTFEIPELTVNNRHPEAKKNLGDATDAVAINHKVAERLSGADFDGDTVLVIPNNTGKIKTQPALEGLKNFDPKTRYKAYEGMPQMTGPEKQREMGYISNLITDMTIKGANAHELAAAVRHSMVVIDAEKHNLNYRQSAIDNNIPSLMEKYQNRRTGGAATLISKSGLNSKKAVPQRKQNVRIDPVTGRKIYEETGATYVNKQGKTVLKTDKVPRLSLVDDAHELSSGMPIERVYADHSNRMKALANQARREYLATQNIERNSSAATAYAKEVTRLQNALDISLRNAPLERQAQILANANYRAKLRANPDMDKEEKKKLKNLALLEARNRVGAGKELIEISDSEWAAIQAGALTQNTVDKILRNTNMDEVKKRATPRTKKLMTTAKIQRALSLKNSGHTNAEIAAVLGVSVSTLKRELGTDG